MKKIYTLICTSFFVLVGSIGNSANLVVLVGGSGNANTFSPSSIPNAAVGDDIVFTWFSGIHNVVSITVPSGALSFNSAVMQGAGTFTYHITVAGNYSYFCSIHGNEMSGTFVASGGSTGVSNPSLNLLATVYPNPFTNKITFEYNSISEVDFYNIVGEKINSFELPKNNDKINIDVTDFPVGVYFIRTKKEGNIFETKKIIKIN